MTHHCIDNAVLVQATFPVFCYQTSNSDAIPRNSKENDTLIIKAEFGPKL